MINDRVINQRQIVAGISGGVMIQTDVALRLKTPAKDDYSMSHVYDTSRPKPNDNWWWD